MPQAHFKVLVLGGTGEAVAVAAGLAQLPYVEVITSLAGRTQHPMVPGQIRTGGFGGVAGLTDYLQRHQIRALIDATHPFAAQMSWHAAAAATATGLPSLMVVRPAWEKVEGDRWIEVSDHPAAVQSLPDSADRLFLTIGRQELAAYATLKNQWFLMRMIEAPAEVAQIPLGLVLLVRGPFTLEQERQLLLNHTIDAVISKNSGGASTYAKIAAARTLNLPVVMVQRPEAPQVPKTESASEAIQWVQAQL